MAYKTLYRSYRPLKFGEAVGQEYAIKTIRNAIINNRIAHAYIFSGPRGVGKTTIARILAKAVNCENLINGEPCLKCASCKSIINNETTDIIELDAASNNGVDDIRSILERVNYAPSNLKFKVYIIDEVHMLSLAAFNALLKTLEEPPTHVIFVLATTEPHKIPLTILSRCQRFDFKPFTINELVYELKQVSVSEKIMIDDEALRVIAEASEGGMRDALSILDQVSAYAKDVITVDDVNNVTGRISNQLLINLLKAIYNKDASNSLILVNELIDMGKEISRMISSLLELCRDILIFKSVNQNSLDKDVYYLDDFISLANTISKKNLFYYVDVLNDTQNKIKFTVSQKIFLEVGIMKMVNATTKDLNDNNIYSYTSNVDDSTIKELEEKVNSLYLNFNNMENEIKNANTQNFKEEMSSKFTFLENMVSKVSSLPIDIEDRINVLEDKINELNNHINNKENIKQEDNIYTNKTTIDVENIINEIKNSLDFASKSELNNIIERINLQDNDIARQDERISKQIDTMSSLLNKEEQTYEIPNNLNELIERNNKTHQIILERINGSEALINTLNSDVDNLKEKLLNINKKESKINDFAPLIKDQTEVLFDDSIMLDDFTCIDDYENVPPSDDLIESQTTVIDQKVSNDSNETLNNLKRQYEQDHEIIIDIVNNNSMLLNEMDKLKESISNNNNEPNEEIGQIKEQVNGIFDRFNILTQELSNLKLDYTNTCSNYNEQLLSLNEHKLSISELKSLYNDLNETFTLTNNNSQNINEQLLEKINSLEENLNKTKNEFVIYMTKEKETLNDENNDNYIDKNVFDEFVNNVNQKINEIKDYSFKVGAKVNSIEATNDQQSDEKHNTKEEPSDNPVEHIISTNSVVVKTKVENVEDTPTKPIVEDITSKVYDHVVIAEILHESRIATNREESKLIVSNWQTLENNVGISLSNIASLLQKGMPVVYGNQRLIISFPTAAPCNYLMTEKNHFEAKQVLKSTFGKEYEFIALPESTWHEKKMEYKEQYQLGTKYPKLKPINNPELRIINIPKDNFNQEKKESTRKAEELFGKELIYKED